jgi:hypothetical protein
VVRLKPLLPFVRRGVFLPTRSLYRIALALYLSIPEI